MKLPPAALQLLDSWLQTQRWFAGKGRPIERVTLVSELPLKKNPALAWQIIAVDYGGSEDRDEDQYLVTWPAGSWAQLAAEKIQAIPTEWVTTADGLQALWGELAGEELSTWLSAEFAAYVRATPTCTARWAPFEQSNTCVIFDERYILKLFRKLSAGINPDVEIGRALAEKAAAGTVPSMQAILAFASNGSPLTVGVIHQYLHGAKTAWDALLELLKTAVQAREQNPLATSLGSVLQMSAELGLLTARMHTRLAQATGPDFAAEGWFAAERELLRASQTEYSAKQIALLCDRLTQLPADTQSLAQLVIDRQQDLLLRFAAWQTVQHCGERIRIHGDYHLGQVLVTARADDPAHHELWAIDFEGEPARPLAERRRKRSPLQDVAGMIRSLHYAVSQTRLTHAPTANGVAWAAAVYPQMVAAYITAYDAGMQVPGLLPDQNDPDRRTMLELFILEKALYELGYELLNRPAWIQVPLAGIAELLEK
jgi:maltose alpha-D-glucosyltransferase/alpha-amylase